MTTTDSARVLLPPSLAFERCGADGQVGILRLSRTAKRNAIDDADRARDRGVLQRPARPASRPWCSTRRASTSPPGSTCPS